VAKPPAGAAARPGNPEAWGEGAQVAAGREFEPIYFSEESTELDFAARRRLANFVQWLHEHPNAWVSLAGHSGAHSTVGMAYNIAMARALVVQDYLVSQGLDLRRFFPISFGRDRPAAEGNTPEAESLNNRVELLAFVAPIGQDAPEPVAVEKGAAPPAEEPRVEERPRQDIP
jgi:peptidoglycan-associated lipoprotein